MSPQERRLFWLLACAALGLGVGFAGFHFSGDQAWFLALPAALLAGWFVFANPGECLPPSRHNGGVRKPRED